MRIFILFFTLTAALSTVIKSTLAEQAYVSDSFKITMRAQASNDSKILAMLSSGEPIEILEATSEWSHVRYQNPEGEAKEGWVLSRFVMDRPPWEEKAKSLDRENASLKEEIAAVEKKWNSVSQGESELKQKYEASAKAVEDLTIENEALRASQKVKWFVAGALVMLAGWMIGLITGRMQRKRRSSFYSFGG
jgi:SH3 domain protein